jgi:hypothetical protein
LFPSNPDRVLRHTPNPPAQLAAPEAAGIEVGICPQDDVLQTPVTPVSAEALTSLHNIIKQEAQTHNGPNVQRLQRHVQKLANAAQVFFADRALLCDQDQFLHRINDEAKVRRSTRSVMLGKAKVMSFEDIEADVSQDQGQLFLWFGTSWTPCLFSLFRLGDLPPYVAGDIAGATAHHSHQLRVEGRHETRRSPAAPSSRDRLFHAHITIFAMQDDNEAHTWYCLYGPRLHNMNDLLPHRAPRHGSQ